MWETRGSPDSLGEMQLLSREFEGWQCDRTNTTFALRELPAWHVDKDCYCCSVVQSCPTLCDPMDCRMPDFPVLHHLPELTQTRVHWVGDVIQPSHPVSFPAAPAFNLSQHQGLFQWVDSFHQVAQVLETQLQYQSFQRIFGTHFL